MGDDSRASQSRNGQTGTLSKGVQRPSYPQLSFPLQIGVVNLGLCTASTWGNTSPSRTKGGRTLSPEDPNNHSHSIMLGFSQCLVCPIHTELPSGVRIGHLC